jgi:hypothetical protein
MPEISIRTPAPVTLSDTGATTGDFDLTFADSSIAHLPLTVIGGTGGTIVSMTDSVQLPAGNMSLALGSTTSVNFANLTIASLNMNFTVYTPVSGQVSWTLPNSYVISFNPSGSDYIIANSFLTLNWDGVTSVPPVAVGDNISVTVHFYLAGRQVASVTKLTTVTTSTTGMSAIFAGVISTQKFDTIQVTMDLTGN